QPALGLVAGGAGRAGLAIPGAGPGRSGGALAPSDLDHHGGVFPVRLGLVVAGLVDSVVAAAITVQGLAATGAQTGAQSTAHRPGRVASGPLGARRIA